MTKQEQFSKTLEWVLNNVFPNDGLPEHLLEHDRKNNLDIVFDVEANQINTCRPHVVARFLQEPEFEDMSIYQKAQLLRTSLISTALIEEFDIIRWKPEGVGPKALDHYERMLQLAAAIHAMYSWRNNGKDHNFSQTHQYPDNRTR